MNGKTLKYERVFHEDRLHAQGLIDSSIGAMQRSVANAFLDNIEYGKDYIIRTQIKKEPMDYGMKHVCTLTFGEVVRCRDCKHYNGWACEQSECFCCGELTHRVEPDGFCSCGERR